MKDLMKKSVKINGFTNAYQPYGYMQEKLINMFELLGEKDRVYCINNGVICFIVDHRAYVLPYTREDMATVKAAGLKEESFYVPFSDGYIPKYESVQWCDLRARAEKARQRYYGEDSAKWCDEHSIGELSNETLKRCYQIPKRGVFAKGQFRAVIKPLANEYAVDCTVIDVLGRFSAKGGKVVFVYRDGHTYVAGDWIVEQLREAGYRESDLSIPFYDGEKLTELKNAAEWAVNLP